MPQIPAAFRRPASVTTHVVDDHDAPGGTDLEAQLVEGANRVPAGAVHPAGVLVDTTGIRFPARAVHEGAPAPAEVNRREPFTAPEISLEVPPDSSIHNVETAEHVQTPGADDGSWPLAWPVRRQVVVGRIRVAGQVTLDGSGNGTAELTPGQWGGGAGTGAGVQQNQRWLLDRLVARGGAAGTCLVYGGAVGVDQDLVAVLSLSAAGFFAQVDGNPVQLNPGWRVAAVFAGAGNGLVATAVAYYRLLTFAPGMEGVE
jgi:hypothetical protein